MIKKARFCCKVCSKVGAVSTHKIYRSLNCPTDNKTAMCNISVTITKKTKAADTTAKSGHKILLHNRHVPHHTSGTGRKVTEIKHGGHVPVIYHGDPTASGQREVQLPVQAGPVGQHTSKLQFQLSGGQSLSQSMEQSPS
jgi:hypothetical protein